MNEDSVNPIDAKMQLYALNRIEPGKDASNSPTGVTDVGGDPYAWRDFSGSGCSLFPWETSILFEGKKRLGIADIARSI